jgi:ferredoxin like protein
MVDVEEKLQLVRFRISPETHIKVNKSCCHKCPHLSCTYICPARCYTRADDGEILFAYEGCLECGSCSIVCDQGAIEWDYPRGGYGVSFRFV